MSDPIFERYKEALKAGHVAVLRGRLEEALGHYETATQIADDRALPHTSVGSVLLRLGRAEEAVAAYERALVRSPNDEAALSGHAEALLAAGRRDETDARGADAVATVEPGPEARDPTAVDDRARDEATFAPPAEIPVDEDADGRAESTPAPEEPTAPDPAPHLAAAESLLVGGDRATAAIELVAAAEAYARLDLMDAALDSANQALRVAPDLPEVHLGLARLYFRRGWRERAADTLVLLDRFLEIEPHREARAALAETARQHLSSDPRLEALVLGDDEGRSGAAV